MLRFIVKTVLLFVADAIGLLLSAVLLQGLTIDIVAFWAAVVVFTLAVTILDPLITKVAFRHASFLMGGISLITTLVGLIITTLITDGLVISGIETWFMATVTIWFFTMIANVLIPMVVFKKVFKDEEVKPDTPAKPDAPVSTQSI